VPSIRSRQDIAAAVLLAALAFGLYSYRLEDAPRTSSEQPLHHAVDLMRAHGERDSAGRWLPLFVQIAPEVWIPPVPVYATLATAAVHRTAHPERRSASVWAVVGVLLTYMFATGLFRRRLLGGLAALLLLTNPAYMTAARSGALDGVWVIVPLLLSLVSVSRVVRTGSRPALAVAAAALAACAYTQPSGALVAVIVGTISLIALHRLRPLSAHDLLWAAGGAAAAALPIAVWFVMHPSSYLDTYGRWLLHPAYIRNPWSLLVRSMNWVSLAEWSSIHWAFLDPTHLLYGAAAPASAGTFPMALGVCLVVAFFDLARPSRLRTAEESALLWISAVGFVAAPLVPASFVEPGAIQKALSLAVFGGVLITLGAGVWWESPSTWMRGAVGLLLALALVQSAAYYRALVAIRP